MKLKVMGKRIVVVAMSVMIVVTTVIGNTSMLKAQEVAIDTSGTMGTITAPATKSANSLNNAVNNVVEIQTLNGNLRVTFLKDNEFRLNFEKTGSSFVENAKPFVSNDFDKVYILSKHASDYAGVEPTITDASGIITLATAKIKLTINKDTSLLKLMDASGNIKWEEKEPIKIVNGQTIQTLKTSNDEYFYGGGTQNGYFSHKNTKIKIETGGGWEDGGRSNPVPFYMSTKGYAVLRHTFTPGEYDFSSTATFMHKEERFDAFYYVNDSLKAQLDSFTEMTGRPVFYPRWAEYIGHADCFNYNANTGERDLNNQGKTLLDKYLDEHNVPLGWMLVNDGYGCHYGKTGTVDGNIQNLRTFAQYASAKGIQTGLWTQSNLRDESPSILRNIDKEVNVAGARAIKTDVAWVGPGYDMQLNSVNSAYQGLAQSGDRPFVFSLNGWAGSQRYAGMWTGDQTGGRWEYIRFMIPSYIGSGLSAQPNVGSDIDSIYKGSKTIATRDLQWKAFTPLLYNMGGWDGSKADELDGKTPWEFGTDSEAIEQFYLKTRAEMTPYNYTNSHTASKTGLPMLRAMILEYPEDPYTYGKETQYQYMWGDNLLVAPVYEGTGKDTDIGIRNNIYLPDANQTWIDYFTGKQYQGGQTINNFEAPLWKLPLFVKSGAIIPMTEENNASLEITDDKDRIFNIYPDGNTSFDLFEDDGQSLNSGTATTHITSSAPEIGADGKAIDGTATITIDKRTESGYAAQNKATELLINTHKEPTSVTLKFNGEVQTLTKVTKEVYQTAVENGDDTSNIYYYDTEYNLAKYDGSEYINDGEAVNPGSRLVLRTVKADVSEVAMTVEVAGFNNSGYVDPGVGSAPAIAPMFDAIDDALTTPTSITLSWQAQEDATSYDLRINGTNVFTNVSKVGETTFLHKDLPNKTSYQYEIRAVNAYGTSGWSAPITVTTKENPFKYSPETITASWDGPEGTVSGQLNDVVDKNMGSQFHSTAGATNKKVVLDMKYAYPVNQFVYVPRQDYNGTGGNGLIQQLDLEVSIDGKTWKKVKENYTVNAGTMQPMFNNVYADVISFDAEFARYVRMTVKASVGTFFTAQELIPCFAEGGKPRTAGTPLEHTNALSDADLIPMKMYSGSIPGDTTWNQVVAADANYNKMSDAYDLVNVTSQFNGGIKPSADKSIDGVINVVLSTTNTLNTNDTVRVDVVANSFKDINALSTELGYDNASFEVVNKETDFLSTGANTLGMVNYSRYNPHGSTSVNPSVFIDLANLGDKERLNGDFVIGSFTLKATANNVTPNVTIKNALIVNSNMVQKDAKTETVVPETPSVVIGKVARKDITLDFTTPGIAHDDGTNLMQNGKSAVEALFDGNLNTTMEYMWSRPPTESVVILPLTMNYTFNTSKKITEFKVYNRISGNGVITEMGAIGYKGSQAYDLGTYSTSSPEYNGTTGVYTFTPTVGGDMFDRVEIIAKKCANMTMLTLREVEFYESNDIATTSVKVTPNGPVDVAVGKMKTAIVEVGPINALNKNVTVTAENPSIVSANLVKDGEGNTMVMMRGLVQGTTKVTVESQADSSVKAELTVNVNDTVDLTDYNKFIAIAKAKLDKGDFYKEEGRTALLTAYNAATSAELETVTQSVLDNLVLEVAKKISVLVERETNVKEKIDGSQLQAEALYSESNKASRVLDDDLNTFWESPYAGVDVGLPKAVTLTLPTISTIRQIDYVPAQARNGLVTEYNVYTSLDGEIYTKVAEGTCMRASESDYSTQSIKFQSTEAKYVKFEATKALGREAKEDNKYVRIAELRLYGVADATAIIVSDAKTELKINETKTITTTLTPTYANDTLRWSSANDSIATVDSNGLITAKSNGTTTITVTGNKASETVEVVVNPLRDITKAITEMETFIDSLSDPLDIYTKNTWNAFLDALDVAKQMKATDIQASIDATEQALKTAHSNLLELSSKEKLERSIVKAEAITNTDKTYTAGSFKTLTEVIATAKAVVNNASATSDELAMAQKELDAAISGLVTISNLKTIIDAVVMPNGDFSLASKEAFDKVLSDAKSVLENDNATSEEVKGSEEAVTIINDKLVDVANLRVIIKRVQAFYETGKDTFIPNYKKSLEDTMASTEKILQEAIDIQEVEMAITALKTCEASPLYKGNKTSLQATIADVASIIANKVSYTTTSYGAFELAYNNGQTILNDENATQTVIDSALQALQDAKNALVKVSQGNGDGITVTVPDQSITVTGNLPPNTTVKAEVLSKEEVNKILNSVKDKEVLRKYTFEKVLDINLLNAGVSYTATGDMVVKIKLDDALLSKDLEVVYIASNGEVSQMKSYVKDGYIYFETTHFSTYAIVSKNKDYKPTNTSDTTEDTTPFATMGLMALCTGYLVIRSYRKTKKD